MQPFAWRDTPLVDVFAAQNLLTNQRHHDSMIHVVVRSIAIGNIFHCQSSDEPDDAGITGLKHPVDLLILLLELFNKRVDDDLYGVKHCNPPSEQMPCNARPLSLWGRRRWRLRGPRGAAVSVVLAVASATHARLRKIFGGSKPRKRIVNADCFN